jgi:hypothetical protein
MVHVVVSIMPRSNHITIGFAMLLLINELLIVLILMHILLVIKAKLLVQLKFLYIGIAKQNIIETLLPLYIFCCSVI